MTPAASKHVAAGTIFTSAFALFLVQPPIAKQILPWFGGSAAIRPIPGLGVWTDDFNNLFDVSK